MLYQFYQNIENNLEKIKNNCLFKKECIIVTPQGSDIITNNGQHVINLCSNNYLGLANDKSLIASAKDAMDNYGFGMASVRFICGTQISHKLLENKLADFLGMEDAILYSSCFDANTGLFEPLFGAEDSIISDSLNHASIIDGIRLCKAKCYRFINNNMDSLKEKLNEARLSGTRYIIIAVDGVTSMDGLIANLQGICKLANEYKALVMVDDSHAVGIIGEKGRGSHEFCNVMGKIDIITGTLGKAIGGASGGYVAARRSVIELLRQNSRPYLFSNSLTPAIASASIKALDIVIERDDLRKKLLYKSNFFKEKLLLAGFTLSGANHAIIPIILRDSYLVRKFVDESFKEGIYVVGFFYPVVTKDKPRIRTQISVLHTESQIIKIVDVFTKIGKKLKIIN
ncbi:2-amino-3-ketobutyrate coenzyme A ligase [Candidatus Providencia siddallii]|uniref:5-aminolevulinate synthase n=1 Tax=Candidatus Providencia siddallii TaxID=1715285 RepID=A0A0M6W9C0_9GAMM|nr:2-amino-3-ketobutyrate coenzyme A ligase [Candidatus Providencia siddallii]